MKTGTPKTLEQAIINAYMEQLYRAQNNMPTKEIQLVIASHVRDFLAQHLQVAFCGVDRSSTEEILGKLCDCIGCHNPVKAA